MEPWDQEIRFTGYPWFDRIWYVLEVKWLDFLWMWSDI